MAGFIMDNPSIIKKCKIGWKIQKMKNAIQVMQNQTSRKLR